MSRSRLTALLLLCAMSPVSLAAFAAETVDDLYSGRAIVTGQGAVNRQPGFRDCLRQAIVRVSGDQRLLARPELAALQAHAGEFVQSYAYHDRLAGKPVHDEQGTYDRPHDLTCRYDRKVFDKLLGKLGSRPWLGKRPSLAILLEVSRNGHHYRVSPELARDEAMRQSFANAAAPLAMRIVFPETAGTDDVPAGPGLDRLATGSGADLPLVGSLQWSDADLGWNATWRLRANGQETAWSVKGVNFDEAFRVAIRGAAQVLSGNGAP